MPPENERLSQERAYLIFNGQARHTIERLTAWFTHQWSGRAPATFNRHLDALRSAVAFWMDQGWLAADPTRRLRRRDRAPDRTRALTVADIEALLDLEVPLREKTLWTMLYETAARASEVLGLDIANLDRRNRRARVTRKGSAVDIIVWQTRTARLLPKLLAGRSRALCSSLNAELASLWQPATWTRSLGGPGCPTDALRRSSTS
ncbi:tyrosine-type recombinase/integrase [Streptosporangium saharense]|uniref:tyrosine-type recombinase/integrase n=1 Tax=Streptosporangium saharense TaxID=1706840 RepID=UPI0034159606